VALCPSKILSATATRRRQHRPEFSFPDGESRLQRPQHAGTIISTPRPRTRTAGCSDCRSPAPPPQIKAAQPINPPNNRAPTYRQRHRKQAPLVTHVHALAYAQLHRIRPRTSATRILPTHTHSSARTRTRIRIRTQARAASESHADLQEYDLQRVMGAHQPTKHTSQLPQHERSHRRVNDRSTATCQRQEYSNLLTTGAQQPQARNRQCAGV